MPITMIDAVNSPAGPGGGDDRYGFDEGAGTAWVVDGATDVVDVRMFETEITDAAWYAEALSQRFVQPPTNDDVRGYVRGVLEDVRVNALAAARSDLERTERHNLPSAAAIWARERAGRVELAWLGDCVALLQRPGRPVEPYGDVEKVDGEAKEAAVYHAASDPAAKLKVLQTQRRRMNSPGGYWVFSIHPEAADQLRYVTAPAPAGARLLLMTDGFYRLVEPYGLYEFERLMTRAGEIGLGALVSELRDHETRTDTDAARVKRADDAAAVLVEMG